MAGRKHKIAYFAVDWNYELVAQAFIGLKRYTDSHPDVYLRVFDCFGSEKGTDKDKSEYRIFTLPDLHDFDGAVILGSQVVRREVREDLIRRIADAGIPAVSVGCPLPGCVLVTHDQRAAQRALADHLIREHGVRTLVYLAGNLRNDCPEAQQRLDGFLDACRKNGIPRENIEVLEKTWRTSDGADVARLWLRESRPLPGAFVCANDEMALGLMETLRENGVQVPGDVIVTGYDNLESALLSCPRLATVSCDYSLLNYRALEALADCIAGKDVPAEILCGYELIASASCGCPDASRPANIRERYFRQVRSLRSFCRLQAQMAEDLFGATSLPDLAAAVLRSREVLGGTGIYLCFNDYYFDNYEKEEWTQDSETYGEEMVLATRDCIRFPARQLLPEPWLSRERFLIFYPLHYNTYSIGFIVLDGLSTAAAMNLHEGVFNCLEIAVENVRKKGLLRRFNEMLDGMYVRDGLTGVYNRFGFERFAQEYYARMMRNHGGARVLFVDLDDMKAINDCFGHDAGDTALRAAVGILRECSGEEAFLMRYGGDEFFVIAPGSGPDLKERILAAAGRFNASSAEPFRLGFSIGSVLSRREQKRPLDECVREADALMYTAKAANKAGR